MYKVQTIIEREDINVGRIIANDLKRLADENQARFRLRYCSLVNALCKAARVSIKPTDLPQRKANNIDKMWFKKLHDPIVQVPRQVPQERIPSSHQA